jgi:hypothetical protein
MIEKPIKNKQFGEKEGGKDREREREMWANNRNLCKIGQQWRMHERIRIHTRQNNTDQLAATKNPKRCNCILPIFGLLVLKGGWLGCLNR